MSKRTRPLQISPEAHKALSKHCDSHGLLYTDYASKAIIERVRADGELEDAVKLTDKIQTSGQ